MTSLVNSPTPTSTPSPTLQQLLHEPLMERPDRARCLAQVRAEELVILTLGTAWQIPWELLMLGPFAECVLDDNGQLRHVTARALLASAARRSSPPGSPLFAADYPPLLTFAPDMTLLDAARLMIEPGWDHAVVMEPLPRLITPCSVLRSLVEAQSAE